MKCLSCKKPFDDPAKWWKLQTADDDMALLFCCLQHVENWLNHLPYGDERDAGRTDLNGVVNDEDILRY